MAGILVYAEQTDGSFRNAALEAISEGRRLANTLKADLVVAMIGSGVTGAAGALGRYGADRVVVVDSPVLARFSSEGYTTALTAISQKVNPSIILLAATAAGKAFAPAVAARMETGLAADCVQIGIGSDGRLRLDRPVYAGKAIATVVIKTEPQIVSLRPNVFPIALFSDHAVAPVECLEVAITPRTRVIERKASSSGRVDLTEAPIIVAGGRGMGAPEHFALLEELAEVVGGVVGASRAVVDIGWRPHGDQVGQTGKTVSPSLYIACGISGAIQHLAGMSSSRCIVAINKDANAPIFQKADYGIVGDVFDVVPALTAELRRTLGK